jgi:hypothetical protein
MKRMAMAYRIKTKFKDGTTTEAFADIVASPTPRRGDTLSVSRHGQEVPVEVTAVWPPASKVAAVGGVAMVEAREL